MLPTDAHKNPRSRAELIQHFRRLRKSLQEHRAEFDEGLQAVQAGREDGASAAARRDGLTIEALLDDIAEETELVSLKHADAAESAASPLGTSYRAQKRRLRLRLADMTEAVRFLRIAEPGPSH